MDYRHVPETCARVQQLWNNLTDHQRHAMPLLERAAFVFLDIVGDANDRNSFYVAEVLHAQVGYTEPSKQLHFIIEQMYIWASRSGLSPYRVGVMREVVRVMLRWDQQQPHAEVQRAMERADVGAEELLRASWRDDTEYSLQNANRRENATVRGF
jgi:hypothetical protein